MYAMGRVLRNVEPYVAAPADARDYLLLAPAIEQPIELSSGCRLPHPGQHEGEVLARKGLQQVQGKQQSDFPFQSHGVSLPHRESEYNTEMPVSM